MTDQVNSTRVITNGSGDVVYSEAYSPYGEVQKTWTDNYKPKMKFSGKEREYYSDLDYFGARYFDKSFRFNSLDPIINREEALVNPQLWNLYAYCSDNPITYFDPDGRLRKNKKGELKFRAKSIGIISHPGDPKTKNKVKFGYLYADDGKKIQAHKNMTKDGRFYADCHGVTFAEGKYWISNPEVKNILKGDNYMEIKDPIVGSVVIYYDNSGEVVHSATVVEVDKNKGIVMVEGLGGLEINAHRDPVEKGWSDPKSTYKYYKKN